MRTFLVFGLGAAAMYLFDPEQGRRRRARLGDALAGGKREEPVTPREHDREGGPFEEREIGTGRNVGALLRQPATAAEATAGIAASGVAVPSGAPHSGSVSKE